MNIIVKINTLKILFQLDDDVGDNQGRYRKGKLKYFVKMILNFKTWETSPSLNLPAASAGFLQSIRSKTFPKPFRNLRKS